VLKHHSEGSFLFQLIGVEIDIFLFEVFDNSSVSSWSCAW
jgi:hypothetical protein